MRTRNMLVAALVAMALLSLGIVTAGPPQQPTGNRTEAEITPERPRLLWSDERVVSSRIPGQILHRLVNDGASVEEGQSLAELDYREAEIENEMQQLLGKSDLAERIQYAKLEEYLARRAAAERLIGKDAISKEEWRLAGVNVEVNDLQAKQEVEKHKVESLKAARTAEVLQDYFIKSPIRGTVQKCYKRAGESVSPSDLQMFRIVATDKLWVEGLIDSSDLFRVKGGQRVTVQLKFRDPRDKKRFLDLPQSRVVFEGNVVFIDTDVDPVSQKFWVRAEVANRDNILRAGLESDMKIYLDESTSTSTGSAK